MRGAVCPSAILIFLIVIPFAGANGGADGTSRPAIAANQLLVLARPSEDPEHGMPRLLDREIIRQAILMAARDGLGLWTRDEVLRETQPAGLGDLRARTVNVSVLFDWPHIRLSYKCNANTGTPLQETFAVKLLNDWTPDLPTALAHIEELSRTKYVDWLKSCGFTGAVKPAGNALAPEDEEAQFAELDLFSQYAAVRAAHQAIRQYGPSPDLLGALVRGYANLGQLTREHWTAAPYVFTARSLLYAQRMVANDPTSPIAHWHRAYAEAMAGLHAAALQDLAQAGGIVADGPPWVALLEPLCKYDTKKLLDLCAADPQDAALAAFMAFLTVDNCGSQTVVLKTGQLVQQVDPLCQRVADDMCNASAGIGSVGELTDGAFATTVQTLRRELPLIKDLPVNVQAAWKAAHTNPDLMADVAEASAAFVEAPEAAEPSWSALGRLLQQENFRHVFRRASFLAFYLGTDASDFAQQTSALILL